MKRNGWIIIAVTAIIGIFIGIVTYNILNDKNKLTSEERTWINENISSVLNILVVKDENVFSKDGKGVFYTFLDDFSNEYGLKVNPINLDETTAKTGSILDVTHTVNENDSIFYKDHYVLVSTNYEEINSHDDLSGKTIGILSSDKDYVSSYLKDATVTFNTYNNEEELFKATSSVRYLIIPRMRYLDKILKNNLEIIYHLSDINNYYILNNNEETFNSILRKYFNTWSEKKNKYIKEEEFKIFTSSLNISDTEIDKLLSIDYNYGFVNNSPYEVIMSGDYGGIIAEYLQEFSEFSGVYFDIKKYNNVNKLVKAINNNKVDLYFAFNLNGIEGFTDTKSGITSSLSIITTHNSDKMIDSIYGLLGETVYVEENSILHNYLKTIGNIDIKTYNNIKELFKLNKKDTIIVMDTYIFDYYKDTKLNNYVSKYNTFINDKYRFKVKSDHTTLLTLLDKYISYLDNSEMIVKGINSHTDTVYKGKILNSIAKYFIISLAGLIMVGFVVYKKGKRIRIAKRIRKDDKVRFIDDLTCLKNRAYLSDFIKTWNNNTIYPQTVIVVDLNNLKEINDKYGVTEGDKQIQAAANALIKTQLDNSDLMRSDGNEFVIYAVGYNQKQIINYLHKLNKELKKLPYNFGAEFGYSTIENNLKTIEDALNEATNDMRSKKAS